VKILAITGGVGGAKLALGLAKVLGPDEVLFAAQEQGRRAGLKHVYVYNDKGCDCAAENRPLESYLGKRPDELHQVKKCSAGCCGEQGILLKKYEAKSNLQN